jgi:ATP-binding cassette, subfamily B, bacterial
MRLLYPYFRRYWKLITLGLLLATVAQMLLWIDPLLLRYVIDRYAVRYADYTTEQFIRGVGLLLLASVSAALTSRMAKNFQDYVLNIVSTRVGADLYCDGIRHSLELPYEALEDQKSGDTLGKLQKVRAVVENFVTTALTSLFTVLFGLAFLTVYAFTLHWVLAAGFFVTMGLLSVLSPRLSQKIKKLQKRIVAETAALAGSTIESLRNVELVKSLGLGRQEIQRLNVLTENIVRLELRKARSVRLMIFVQAVCVIGMRASLMFLMVYFIYTRRITVGQWLALSFYWAYIFGPLQDLGSVFNSFRETAASLEIFKAILSTPIETCPASPVPLGQVESLALEDVEFAYDIAPVLSDISFRATRGETIAFVGPSGSGKTTLVKLVLGLYQPQCGRISYNGKSSAVIDLNELRVQIGSVSQDTQLFSGSIRENLLFVKPEASDDECLVVLKKAACDSLLNRADRGLDTVIGEGGIKISGGEKQRLCIARALLRNPRLLIFDEATSSLDSITEEGVMATIRELASRDVITILIAHRLSTVLHADRIYVLERGHIVETGNHSELVEKKGLYYAIWRQQVQQRPDHSYVPWGSTLPVAASG